MLDEPLTRRGFMAGALAALLAPQAVQLVRAEELGPELARLRDRPLLEVCGWELNQYLDHGKGTFFCKPWSGNWGASHMFDPGRQSWSLNVRVACRADLLPAALQAAQRRVGEQGGVAVQSSSLNGNHYRISGQARLQAVTESGYQAVGKSVQGVLGLRFEALEDLPLYAYRSSPRPDELRVEIDCSDGPGSSDQPVPDGAADWLADFWLQDVLDPRSERRAALTSRLEGHDV